MNGMQLENVPELKYFWCVLGESGTDVAEYHRKVMSGGKVGVAIRFLVKARGL